ncbi:DUF6332 family protein [Streptomyces sp. NPDC006875]|uniref:DUF6332 family protein n=1 Tax=Streptomyces sp. NPDC006875 TaxID=3154781 RepID=UPI0033FEB022
MRPTRTQDERDAMTVEIGYALFSAAFAAVLALGAVSGPALLFRLPFAVEKILITSGIMLAVALFAVRVVTVLIRFGRAAGAQPSHPGRTNPDS